MESLLDTLSGIERVKYLKALIEKVNNVASKSNPTTRTQPATEEPQICSACASKSKRYLLECSRNSNKIDLKRTKPLSQTCDVHRLRFVRHINDDSERSSLNASKYEVKPHRQAPQIQTKTFEAVKDASIETEKRYLRQIYSKKPPKMNNHQPRKPNNAEIKKVNEDEPGTDRAACQIHSARVHAKENIRPVPQQSRPISDAVLPQQSGAQLANSIVAQRGRRLIGDGGVANRHRTVAVTNAQQSIADPVITVSSDGTRRIAGQSCAHCHRAISDVAFFNGNRQLCVECADTHFRRVTTARFTNRPMSYREFKLVGGDTLYSKSN